MTQTPHIPQVRVAIIGTGGIANAHAEALRQQPGVELAAAVDIDAARAQEFAATWGVTRTAASLQEARDGGGLDLVAICTPPSGHFPLALEALSLGLHAVIEKPPALSLAQMRELQAAEAASTGSLSCIFQHRFGSGAQRLRRSEERRVGKECRSRWSPYH